MGTVITSKVTTPEDATVVDGNQSEKSNISDAGFSSRPTLQRQFFTKDATSLTLEEYPAGGYAPRIYGYINLSSEYAPAWLGTGLFTEKEFEVGYARRRIWPPGQTPKWRGRAIDMDEYSLVGKGLTIKKPLFYSYTGWYQAATGCTRYFQVLYKYNSKYDPN